MQHVHKWDAFEWERIADVSEYSNPFAQIKLSVRMDGPGGRRRFDGFYDGGGAFRFRYMPLSEGEYAYAVISNHPALNGLTGEFTCIEPREGNRGPVYARGTHFYYADGSGAFIMGTTAYAWHYRPRKVRERTLKAFSDNGFNKIRTLFFPKQYTGGYGAIDVSYEPPCYPFEGAPRAFDFARPNPEYFRAFERRIEELDERGIIMDVILFHPYDTGHWDLDAGMDDDDALFYARYMVARLAAYKNVWWSLANEYDIDPTARYHIGPNRREWDVIGETIRARDPAGHPISCHNISSGWIYPDRPWLTHVSYQHTDTFALMLKLKGEYGKPVIDDEYQYEGNVPDEWGNSSPELTLERHWLSVMAGGYATHGEAYIRVNNRDIFWSYGGNFTGESARRLKYLRDIVETCPFEDMTSELTRGDGRHYYSLHKGNECYLIFMRDTLPNKRVIIGDWSTEAGRTRASYHMTLYDVWNMKVLEETVLPPGSRLPIREWTAAVIKLLPD